MIQTFYFLNSYTDIFSQIIAGNFIQCCRIYQHFNDSFCRYLQLVNKIIFATQTLWLNRPQGRSLELIEKHLSSDIKIGFFMNCGLKTTYYFFPGSSALNVIHTSFDIILDIILGISLIDSFLCSAQSHVLSQKKVPICFKNCVSDLCLSVICFNLELNHFEVKPL